MFISVCVCAPLISPETFDLYPASDCVWHPLTPWVPWQARASPSHQNTSFPCQCSLTATWTHFQFTRSGAAAAEEEHHQHHQRPVETVLWILLDPWSFMSVCEPWSSERQMYTGIHKNNIKSIKTHCLGGALTDSRTTCNDCFRHWHRGSYLDWLLLEWGANNKQYIHK